MHAAKLYVRYINYSYDKGIQYDTMIHLTK